MDESIGEISQFYPNNEIVMLLDSGTDPAAVARKFLKEDFAEVNSESKPVIVAKITTILANSLDSHEFLPRSVERDGKQLTPFQVLKTECAVDMAYPKAIIALALANHTQKTRDQSGLLTPAQKEKVHDYLQIAQTHLVRARMGGQQQAIESAVKGIVYLTNLCEITLPEDDALQTIYAKVKSPSLASR